MFNSDLYKNKMLKTIEVFSKELASLRTGRANASMLDLIKVDVYGQLMPIDQLATVSTPEARLISIQVWDKANINLIDAAIQKSELGINPQIDGQIIRLRIPDLTEERRKELVKLVKQEGENCKVSVRNIRRDANNKLKQLLKEKSISEDDEKRSEEDIQKLTDSNIKQIDERIIEKEKDLMQI